MAQNFRRYTINSIGTTAQDAPNGVNFDTYDTIISIRLANVTGNMILVSAYLNDGTNDIHLVKDAPIPAGSSLELIDGGAKIVVASGDRLWIQSDTAASCDAWVSVVDDIST